MDLNTFYPIIAGALSGATSAGVFKGPIQTLEDWWYINFGHSVSEKANLLRAQQDINIEKLKNETLSEIIKIQPENVQNPKLRILGPALEASKFYIEEDEIRSMFAKLIASSLDSNKNSKFHASFVEIIKQMDPIDAENLSYIFNNKYNAICNIKENFPTGGYFVLYEHVFISNTNQTDHEIQSASLTNLERLGLISISYSQHFNDQDIYDKFKSCKQYIDAKAKIDNDNALLESGNTDLPQDLEEMRKKSQKFSGPSIEKGIIQITPLGHHFCEICIK